MDLFAGNLLAPVQLRQSHPDFLVQPAAQRRRIFAEFQPVQQSIRLSFIQALDETATAYDLEQTPADLVALSFSDSDLGAFAAGWHRANGALPTLRLE